MVTSGSALDSSAKALEAAYEIASYNKDMEAIIAISDRWLAMWKMIEIGAKEHRVPMGFTNYIDEEEDEHDS